jgi:hypothetical protein
MKKYVYNKHRFQNREFKFVKIRLKDEYYLRRSIETYSFYARLFLIISIAALAICGYTVIDFFIDEHAVFGDIIIVSSVFGFVVLLFGYNSLNCFMKIKIMKIKLLYIKRVKEILNEHHRKI